MPRILCNVLSDGHNCDPPCDYVLIEIDPTRARWLCERIQLVRRLGAVMADAPPRHLLFTVWNCVPVEYDDVEELEGAADAAAGAIQDAELGVSWDLVLGAHGYFVLPDDFRFAFEDEEEEDEDRPRLGADTLLVSDDDVAWEIEHKHGGPAGYVGPIDYGQLAQWAGLVAGDPYRRLTFDERFKLNEVPGPTWIDIASRQPE